jgi:hypothetical protein
VHLLRRAVHDVVAPEAARAGAEAPEQGGLPRRGDERAVLGVQRAPLQRLNVEQHNAGKQHLQRLNREDWNARLPFTLVAAHAYDLHYYPLVLHIWLETICDDAICSVTLRLWTLFIFVSICN